MELALCQMPDIVGDVDRCVDAIVEMLEGSNADLAVLPECVLQGYVTDREAVQDYAMALDSAAFDNVLRRLAHLRPTLVIGMIERRGDAVFNSAAVVQRGVVIERYAKTRLLRGEKLVFAAGYEQPVFDLAGTRVGIAICNDLNDADLIRALADQGAELIACPCNNMLEQPTAEDYRERHNQIRCLRAVESNVWLASADVFGWRGDRVSYGPTAMIDPLGRVTAQLPLGEPGVLHISKAPA